VSAAAFIGAQNTTNTTLNQWVPPCVNSTGVVPPYCLNNTTGETYCYTNGNSAGYCNNGGCNDYHYGAQAQSQNQYGDSMMGRTANGYGMGCR
jgi:hypothetical protein